jgi:hypothetical protein
MRFDERNQVSHISLFTIILIVNNTALILSGMPIIALSTTLLFGAIILAYTIQLGRIKD